MLEKGAIKGKRPRDQAKASLLHTSNSPAKDRAKGIP